MSRKLKLELIWRCTILLGLACLLRSIPVWSPPLLQHIRSGFPYEAAPQTTVSVPAEDRPSEQILSPAPQQPVYETPERRRFLPLLRFRDLLEETPSAAETPALPDLTSLPDFSSADAGKIAVRGSCTLPYDAEALLAAPLPVQASADGPQILIVQTHSTEAFMQEDGWEYEETELCRTLDPEYSVIRLGAEIASVLEHYGIAVLHDKTINDYPSYAGSYDRMEAIIQTYLAKYPSIRMVLDVHRDAFDAPDGSLGGTAEDGTARVMLVTGTNEGGLYHPNWEDNLSVSMKLEYLMNTNNPGLSRGISLTTQRYNQHLTPMSLLAEFGAAGDTLQEAISAARAFACSLAQLLSSS